jgi:hypothetical protein
MHIRIQSIGLMPEIEDNCMQDLATCRNPEIKGEVKIFNKIAHAKARIYREDVHDHVAAEA